MYPLARFALRRQTTSTTDDFRLVSVASWLADPHCSGTTDRKWYGFVIEELVPHGEEYRTTAGVRPAGRQMELKMRLRLTDFCRGLGRCAQHRPIRTFGYEQGTEKNRTLIDVNAHDYEVPRQRNDVPPS